MDLHVGMAPLAKRNTNPHCSKVFQHMVSFETSLLHIDNDAGQLFLLLGTPYLSPASAYPTINIIHQDTQAIKTTQSFE